MTLWKDGEKIRFFRPLKDHFMRPSLTCVALQSRKKPLGHSPYKPYPTHRSLTTFNSLSETAPGRPLGLQAAFLSKSEIQVTWSPPDDPNGVITQYRIFYKPKEYSFWHSKLDWCSRDVTGQSSTDALETSGKNSSSLG